MIALENASTLEHLGMWAAFAVPVLGWFVWHLNREVRRLERTLRVRENHIAQLNRWCDQHHKEIR